MNHLPSFEMPPVYIGCPVLWSYGAGKDEKRSPAVVTDFGDRTVQLTVFLGGYTQVKVYDGVYHADDPLRKLGNRGDNGAWELSKLPVDILAVCELIQKLNSKYERLEGRLEGLTNRFNKLARAKGQPEEEPPVAGQPAEALTV